MLLIRTLIIAFLFKLVSGIFELDSEDYWYSFLIPRTRDDICQPSRTGMKEYYGFRIQQQLTGRLPFIRHTRISECDHTQVQGWDAYIPTARDGDIAWGKKLCQQGLDGQSLCLIIARTKKMARRNTSLFVHGSYVGGIFQCPGRLEDDEFECTNENVLPLYPIYADDPFFAWTELPDVRHFLARIPMIASADESNFLALDVMRYTHDTFWYREIDIHEDYDYTVDERSRLYRVYDNMYKRIAAVATFPIRLNMGLTSGPIDKGDDIPRRPVYKRNPRRLFEPHLWKTNDIHPAPLRSDDDELVEDFEVAAMTSRGDADFQLPYFDFETITNLMMRTDPKEWVKMKQDVEDMFENVVDTVPNIYHPAPPKNVTEHLRSRLKGRS